MESRGEFAGLFGIFFAAFLISYIGWGTWPDDGIDRFLLTMLALVVMGVVFGIWLGIQDKFWT